MPSTSQQTAAYLEKQHDLTLVYVFMTLGWKGSPGESVGPHAHDVFGKDLEEGALETSKLIWAPLNDKGKGHAELANRQG